MSRTTGTVYDLVACEANDGIHVETCGWNDYIVFVKSEKTGGDGCMITISRRAASVLVRNWMAHIDEMDEQDHIEAMEAEE